MMPSRKVPSPRRKWTSSTCQRPGCSWRLRTRPLALLGRFVQRRGDAEAVDPLHHGGGAFVVEHVGQGGIDLG